MRAFLLLLTMMLGMFVSAQQKNLPISTDTIQGAETVFFEPSYSSFFVGAEDYSGVTGFIFEVDNVADSLATLQLYGSYDGSTYILVSSIAETSTEGVYTLNESPPKYLKYKISASCIAGDTVILKNIRYFQKTQ